MPEKANSNAASTPVQFISNSVDNMLEGNTLGPDQANVRIVSMAYITNDYNGTVTPAAIVAHAIFSPTDGANDNKDFEAQWSIGRVNENDFTIMNDGGHLVPGPGSTKGNLNKNSNFAAFQNSIKDTGWDPAALDGPTGICAMAGYEMVIKRIPQPKREGLEEKNAKGYDKTMYTCLKMLSVPGQSKRAGGKDKPATTNAASKPATGTTKPAAAAQTNGAITDDVLVATISQILSDAGNSIPFKDLKSSFFRAFKDDGKSVADAQKYATKIADADYLVTQSMERDLNWTVDGDTLLA